MGWQNLHVDLNGVGNKLLNVLELVQLVLAQNVVLGADNHASHQTSKRGNSVTLADTQDTRVDVGSTGLQSAKSI